MKIKMGLLQTATILTIILILYTGLTLIDQTYQTMVVTNENKLSKPIPSQNHLKQLGFSDIAISHMSQSDINQYNRIKGNVVDKREIYRQITNSDEKRMSKKRYHQLLKKYATSKVPHSFSLERVSFRLVYEGNRNFLLISEHHFDYSPYDLIPLKIEVQLRPDYQLTDQTAKEIWWTTSSLHKGKIKSGVEPIDPTINSDNSNEINFMNEDPAATQSLFYSVPWKPSSIIRDTVGLHFFTATRFTAPKDRFIIDAYIQGQNPHLSEQLMYKIDKAN